MKALAHAMPSNNKATWLGKEQERDRLVQTAIQLLTWSGDDAGLQAPGALENWKQCNRAAKAISQLCSSGSQFGAAGAPELDPVLASLADMLGTLSVSNRPKHADDVRVCINLLEALTQLLSTAREWRDIPVDTLARALAHFWSWEAIPDSRAGCAKLALNAVNRGHSVPSGAPTCQALPEQERWNSRLLPNEDRGPASEASGEKGRYKPPHLRGGSQHPSRPAVRPESGSCSSESSDSDSGGTGRHIYARLRIASLQAFQALGRSAGKRLHHLWPSLLVHPEGSAPDRHPATLADLILSDLDPKVRVCASSTLASLLEGPAQKAFLSMAESLPPSAAPVRAFTTLSMSLGHMVVRLQRSLCRMVATESNLPALAAACRALATLLDQAPLSRLPRDLLVEAVEVASRRYSLLADPKAPVRKGDRQALGGVLILLASAFTTREPNGLLASRLCPVAGIPPARGTPGEAQPLQDTLRGLPATLLTAVVDGDPGQTLGALAALRGLAGNYHAALLPLWDRLLAVATSFVGKHPLRN
eukprot:jgi/Botrbrau1/8696/Bobra.0311s0011.1